MRSAAGVYHIPLRMRNVSPLQVLQSISAEVVAIFGSKDADHDGKLTVEETANAIAGLNYKFDGESVSQLIAEMDEDGDGFVKLQEFERSFSSPYGSEALWSAFTAAAVSNNDDTLSCSELHKALKNLGVKGIAEIYTERLPELLNTAGESLSFDTFCRLTCPGCLNVHKNSLPALDPAASWNEIVRYSHYMIGAMVGGVLAFAPKPTSSTSTVAAPAPSPILFAFQPNKSLPGRWFDVLFCVFLVGWAGAFLVSLCERNTFKGRKADCVSLVCGMILLGMLLGGLNFEFVGAYIVLCFFFAHSLSTLIKT